MVRDPQPEGHTGPHPDQAKPLGPRERGALGLLLAAATAVRLVWVLVVHRPVQFDYSDMHAYMVHARHLAAATPGSSQADWYFPSGTAAVLSLFLRVFGSPGGWTAAAVAQALFSGAEVALLFFGVRRAFGDRVAWTSAVLLAGHYLAVDYAGYFLSETWVSVAVVGACAAFLPDRPRRCLGAGLLLGLATWAKVQAFVLAPMWVLWLLRSRKWASAWWLVAGLLLIVVPVSVFASVRGGHATFVAYNGGQNFALGQCAIRSIEYTTESHESGSFRLPVQVQRAERGEVEATWPVGRYATPFSDSGYYFHEGLRCIARDPWHTLRMMGLHIADTFAGPPWSGIVPWPSSHAGPVWSLGEKWRVAPYRALALASNWLVAYVFLPLALLGTWRARRDPAMQCFVILPMASVLASAIVFHGDPRFRVPYEFCLFIAAAYTINSREGRDARRGLPTRRSYPARPSAPASPP